MNPSATLRFRRATALAALLWSLAALGVAVSLQLDVGRLGPPFTIHGMATDPWRIGETAPSAAAAGVAAGDRLVAVDGVPVERALLDPSSRFEAGHANRYRLRRGDGTERAVDLRPEPVRSFETGLSTLVSLLLPLIGFICLGIGAVVWRLRPGRTDTWALFLFCCVVATELFLPPRPLGGVAWVMNWINLPVIGATAFHLFTTFPTEPAWVVRRPSLRVVPFAAAIGIGVFASLEGLVGFDAGIGKAAAMWFTVGMTLLCFAIGVRERNRLREAHTRDRADMMLGGALVSFAPTLAVVVASSMLGSPVPWYLAFASIFVFPLAVGYGIVRKQLFEVRVMARSSASYGAVTLAITGVYASLIVFADVVVSRFNVDARSPWFSVLFLFFAILAFNPLRTRMIGLVDRMFDRDHALYRAAVREISEAMVSMLSTKEVVDRILVALTETMGVRRALVMLQVDDGRFLAPASSRGEWEEDSLSLVIPLTHPLCDRLLVDRDALARGDFDDEPDLEARDACRDVFDLLEVELIVPIPFGNELQGIVAVGRKVTGDHLTADDRQLLLTLANQSSIAIENGRAFDEIANLNATLEARVEERTRELRDTQVQLMQSEKMRSLGQLVAGVAHELNNPIGFVHANLQLLQEYTRRLVEAQRRGEDPARLEEAIERLLERSREGTQRVTQIVADLRTFSRMDQADLAEVELNEEIDRTIALMHPRLGDGIELERDYGDLPPVRCYAGQLNQVFMNLLMNATDVLAERGGKGHIRVKTRPLPDGVRLEFHDDGPGIAPEEQARIFEPFYTTKPVGQGTGLGLSISYGIVERHGGRMLVGSKPGQGTSFIIELPLVACPPDAGASEGSAA